MDTQSNVIELFRKHPPTSNDEDFLVLLDNGKDYICYVRNYSAFQEFIFVSTSIMKKLPMELRPLTNVFVTSNFHALRQFKYDIQQYILESEQLNHYYYLFESANIDQLFGSQ